MTILYKQGVRGDLQPVAQKGKGRVAKLYESKGKDLVVTSQREGTHSPGTLHEIGLAFDFRRADVALEDIKKVLGSGWDVLLSNHGAVHAEYDPK